MLLTNRAKVTYAPDSLITAHYITILVIGMYGLYPYQVTVGATTVPCSGAL